jgi:trigger factor
LEDIEKQARRDITLQLICYEYANKLGMKVDPQKLSKLVDEFLRAYNGQPQIQELIYKDPKFLAHLESIVLDEQFVLKVKEFAQIDIENISYDKLIDIDIEKSI